MNLKYLKQFLDLSRFESMSQYAVYAKVTHAQVSRMVMELEKELGYQLLIRDKSKTSIKLTSKGETLIKRIPVIFREIEQMKALLETEKDLEQGNFDLYTTHYLIDYWISPQLAHFRNSNPSIVLNLFGREDSPTPEEKKTMFTISPQSEATGVHHTFLRNFHIGLWASETYIKRYGRPEHVSDLARHVVLCFERKWNDNSYPTINWYMNNVNLNLKPENIIIIRSSVGIMRAAESGLGIFSLSDEGIKTLGLKFERILPHIEGPVIPMCLSYPSAWKDHKSIKKIEEFLVRLFKERLP